MNITPVNINSEVYQLITDYKDNDHYRQSLNKLTRKTFGFEFENWYKQGYWKDRYIPHSLLYKEEIVANVSANTIDFLIDGNLYHTLQIGTVMTEEAFRDKGLSRYLIDVILKENEGKCDLIYLYANDTVLNFYPKFGFKEAAEYVHIRQFKANTSKMVSRKLDMNASTDKDTVSHLVTNTVPASKISMIGNMELDMFYLTSFMSENIYYIDKLDLIAIAEYNDDGLFLMDVFCEHEFGLDEVINSLVSQDEMKVTLGFTPMDASDYCCGILKEEGTTFFIKGEDIFKNGKFPLLSHA
ncbi:MAG TPA: GNAT family N-acetyltransferase [Mobilitalea sp.]|nr:GNAT family N-acetyltransferase [Mobilitalea sp.]